MQEFFDDPGEQEYREFPPVFLSESDDVDLIAELLIDEAL